MTVLAWRLVRAARADDAFSGEGARIFGGRWNPPGVGATYLSGARSLAALEVLVHQADRVPVGLFYFFEVRFKEALVSTITTSELDAKWQSYPPRAPTVALGRDWILQKRSAVLRVPSVLIPEEWNYLLNPDHPQAGEIEFGRKAPFTFDVRLLKAQG